jgi:colicin import membrane protein
VRLDRLLSFLLSLCLHLAAAAVILWWPASALPPPEPPRGAMVQGMVTIGKAGKAVAGSRRETPEGQRGRPDDGADQSVNKTASAVEKPRTETQAEKSAAQVATLDTPPARPEVRPIEKAVETTPPAPPPDATPIPKDPEKKPLEKTPPPVRNDQKTATEKPDAGESKKAEAKTPETKKPEPKKDIVGDALADLGRQSGKKGDAKGGRGRSPAGKGSGRNLSSALEDLGKHIGGSGDDAAGTGPGGSGGDGYGALGSYQDSIISRVRPNWSWPGRTDRRNFTAVVNINIDASGLIKGARIISSSGNAFFDATVMRAVAATDRLEPPPHPDLMDINISFTPEALGAH